MDNLQRARTEQVNKESAARLAKQKADQAAADAKASQDAAVAALTNSKHKFDEQRDRDHPPGRRARKCRGQARGRPTRGRAVVDRPGAPGAPVSGDRWDPGAPAARPAGGRKWDGWDPTLPLVPSANIQGDPVAVINQVLGISATSTSGHRQHGEGLPAAARHPQARRHRHQRPGRRDRGPIPRVYGRQASEYVIRRGMSQIGVPYSWGGGTAAGPSKGIDSGAGITGFDCSG